MKTSNVYAKAIFNIYSEYMHKHVNDYNFIIFKRCEKHIKRQNISAGGCFPA